uniref:Uncharacterized protein n=1 Tax=Oryza glaberrima TaxID=4538 RepID=I1P2S9_ORYGL
MATADRPLFLNLLFRTGYFHLSGSGIEIFLIMPKVGAFCSSWRRGEYLIRESNGTWGLK